MFVCLFVCSFFIMCRRNILQDINNTCTFHKIRNPRCPIFRLGDIFQETGDNFSEVAIQVCAVRCGVGAGRWKTSNGHESGPRGLKSMAPFTEHLVNPCTMPRLFSTLPHLIPQRASREIPGVLGPAVTAGTDYHGLGG